ncbi:hypothetical protein [Streptomyces tendae]|uniref:hypothetical protein n=1 Tax=Streptomyces tendae TaxID=1932 RepID=UPI0038021F2B
MARLIKAVFVKDPERNQTVLLHPGEEPEPRLAALVTNPDAWEDGQLPSVQDDSADSGKDQSSEDSTDKADPPATKPAARKPAAKKPARGRDAADEGNSGD